MCVYIDCDDPDLVAHCNTQIGCLT
jgi:hypothetical protein